ncbi:hypothetical protein KAU45_06540, partial [bacterium]|nr:hypothetical protein [bacterium]
LVVKETEVEYNPFDMLAGEVWLEVTRMVGAEVRLEQMSGGRLNVTELFKSREQREERPPLFIEDARLVNALFRYDYLDEGKEDLEFNNLSGKVTLFLENRDVFLTGLALGGRTNLYGGQSFWASGDLTIIRHGPLKFNGFSLAIPSSLFYLNGELEPKQRRMDLDVFSPHFSLAELRRIGLGELDPSGDAEIAVRLSGSFTDPRVQLVLKLRNPAAAGYLLDELELRGGYADNRFVVDEFRLHRGGGRATGTAVIDLSQEQPVVRAEVDFYGLDPAELAPITLADLPGDFNGRLTVNGNGDAVGSLSTEVELFPSRLKGLRIDQLRLSGHGTINDFVVTEGFLRVGGGRINFHGRIADNELAFAFDGRGVSLNRFGGLVGEEEMAGRLDFRATLAGPITDLETRFELLLSQGAFAGFTIERAQLGGSLFLTSTGAGSTLKNLIFDLRARNSELGENRVGQARVKGELWLSDGPTFRGDVHLADITVAGRTFEELEGRVNLAPMSGEIEKLHLILDSRNWVEYRGRFKLTDSSIILETEILHAIYGELDLLNARPFTAELTEDSLTVGELELVSAAGTLTLEGTYAFEERELTASLRAPEIDLGALNAALNLTEKPMRGLARLNLEV